MVETEKRKAPKKIAYFYAVLPFIAGCVICSLLGVKMVRSIMDAGDAYPRMMAPGVENVTLTEPGDYTIFFEHKSVIGNKAYVAPKDAISGMTCSIRNAETGQEIPVKPSSANMSYSFGSREGTSLFEFTIPSAGNYRIEAAFPGGLEPAQKYVLAISKGFMKDIFQSIGMGFAITGILILSIGLSTAAIVIVYLRRSKAEAASGDYPSQPPLTKLRG